VRRKEKAGRDLLLAINLKRSVPKSIRNQNTQEAPMSSSTKKVTQPVPLAPFDACHQRFGSDPVYRNTVYDPQSAVGYLLEKLDREAEKAAKHQKEYARVLRETQQRVVDVVNEKDAKISDAIETNGRLFAQAHAAYGALAMRLHLSESFNECQRHMAASEKQNRQLHMENMRSGLRDKINQCWASMETQFTSMLGSLSNLGKRLDACEGNVAHVKNTGVHRPDPAKQQREDALVAERDRLAEEKSKLVTECNRLSKKENELTAECSRLKREKEAAVGKRDKAKEEIGVLKSENDALKARMRELEKEYKTLDDRYAGKLAIIEDEFGKEMRASMKREKEVEENFRVAQNTITELTAGLSRSETRSKNVEGAARHLQEELRKAKELCARAVKDSRVALSAEMERQLNNLEGRFIQMENTLARVLIVGSIALSLMKHHCPGFHGMYFGAETNIGAIAVEKLVSQVFGFATAHVDYSAIMFGTARQYVSYAIALGNNKFQVTESALEEIAQKIVYLSEYFFFFANTNTARRFGKFFPNPEASPFVILEAWESEPGLALRVVPKKDVKSRIIYHPVTGEPFCTMHSGDNSILVLSPTVAPLFVNPMSESVQNYNKLRK
jgi:hypothetical protein